MLIPSQFIELGTILKRYLQDTFGRELLYLHGCCGRKQRDQMLGRFQSLVGLEEGFAQHAASGSRSPQGGSR